MQAITRTTLDNLQRFERGDFLLNEICYQCEDKGSCEREKKHVNCF